jgi:hypothetical protein
LRAFQLFEENLIWKSSCHALLSQKKKTFQILFSLGNLIPFSFKKLLHMELGWDLHLVPFSPRIFSSPIELNWGYHIILFSQNKILALSQGKLFPKGFGLGYHLFPFFMGKLLLWSNQFQDIPHALFFSFISYVKGKNNWKKMITSWTFKLKGDSNHYIIFPIEILYKEDNIIFWV